MVRDRTARARIREHLLHAGPVAASSGNATSALREAVGYEGSAVAFIQLVAAMERDGEVERDIRGKRTYRIAAGPHVKVRQSPESEPPAQPSPAGPVEIDYELLARSIVREMMAEPKLDGQTDDLAALAAERDAYIRRLQHARGRIDELLGEATRSAGSAGDR